MMWRAFLCASALVVSLSVASEASACRNPPPTPPVDVQEARLMDGAIVIVLGITEPAPRTEIPTAIRPTEVLLGTPPELIIVGDEIVITDCPASVVPNLPQRWNSGDEVLVVMTIRDGELRPYDISLLSDPRGQRLLARARHSIMAAQ
jgi:hypothetical protein